MSWYEVPAHWPECEHWISEALKHGSIAWSVQDIYDNLISRNMQLWRTNESCAVTSLQAYPRAKVCMILLCGGENLENWKRRANDICEWAREQGCNAVEAPGRKGWGRILGWEAVWTMHRKVL